MNILHVGFQSVEKVLTSKKVKVASWAHSILQERVWVWSVKKPGWWQYANRNV